MSTVHFKPGIDLTFKSVVKVRAQLYKLLVDANCERLNFDLSEVAHCDSAGVALLIEARKLCQKNNKHLEIIGMSAQATALADFCGVKDILQAV